MPAVLGPLSPLAHVEVKHWDEVIAVNVTATWRLIRAMDPLLRASDAGRVVLVTSGVAQKPRAYWGPYAVSKAAVDCIGRTYAANAPQRRSASICSIRGRRARGCAPRPCRGEDPATLPLPEAPAAAIVELCLPSCTENGRLYDFRTQRLYDFQPPA